MKPQARVCFQGTQPKTKVSMTRGGFCSHWLDFGEEQGGADCLKSLAFVPTTQCQGPAPLTNDPVSPQS